MKRAKGRKNQIEEGIAMMRERREARQKGSYARLGERWRGHMEMDEDRCG